MSEPTVFLVDDDPAVRDALTFLLNTAGFRVEAFGSGEEFLESIRPGRSGCIILDMTMPGMSGFDVQTGLAARHVQLPVIFLTAHGSIPLSVQALKAGAADFLEKPADGAALIERVRNALAGDADAARVRERFGQLTGREREIMAHVAAGLSNKEIARRLDISHRTVEVHRARLLEKMGARSAVELAAMAKACGLDLEPPASR
jgi:FixJ family two-component response regulator